MPVYEYHAILKDRKTQQATTSNLENDVKHAFNWFLLYISVGGQHNYGRMHVLFTIVPVQQSHRVVSPLNVVYEHVSCCMHISYTVCVHVL